MATQGRDWRVYAPVLVEGVLHHGAVPLALLTLLLLVSPHALTAHRGGGRGRRPGSGRLDERLSEPSGAQLTLFEGATAFEAVADKRPWIDYSILAIRRHYCRRTDERGGMLWALKFSTTFAGNPQTYPCKLSLRFVCERPFHGG